VTHLYTLLAGGLVLPGTDLPDATAIAWAEGTVLALGTDADVRAMSRGDSQTLGLDGAAVIPLGADGQPRWPADGVLEVGGPADMAVLKRDPRDGGPLQVLALIREGRLVLGALPGGRRLHDAADGHRD
jgi:predicted amidohydrolase YtcJ